MPKYLIRPQQMGVSTEHPAINLPYLQASWGSKNFKLREHAAQKRWGYNTADRSLGVNTQHVVLFRLTTGTDYTLYLTDSDLCARESAGTWSYKTIEYTTGTVTDISSATVTGSSSPTSTAWTSALVNDYFVLDEDLTAASEPDSSWRKISAASTTSLTLASAYQKNISSQTKAYHIRRVYTTPENERWSWSILDDKFIFTNRDTDVQYFDGSTGTIESTPSVARHAKYCIEFANRLIIADYGATREPLGIAWSKEGDPTDWTDSTAGSQVLLETVDFIMGLGRIGTGLIVYKEDSIMFANRTGVATAPFSFTKPKMGVGNAAPYSIVDVLGTNCFIGRNDFYMIEGDHPKPIGEKIRDKFFEIVSPTEMKRVFGGHNQLANEVMWIANTSEGKLGFAWNYKYNEWSVHSFANDITAIGKGENP